MNWDRCMKALNCKVCYDNAYCDKNKTNQRKSKKRKAKKKNR